MRNKFPGLKARPNSIHCRISDAPSCSSLASDVQAPGAEDSRRANDEWNEALDCVAGDGRRDDDYGRVQDHGCEPGGATAGSSRRPSRRPSGAAPARPSVSTIPSANGATLSQPRTKSWVSVRPASEG